MFKLKCFDIVEMAVDEVTEKLSPNWVENSERKLRLEKYCSALDSLSEEIQADTFDISIDDRENKIYIGMEGSEISDNLKQRIIKDFANHEASVCFSVVPKNGTTSVLFSFPGIWERHTE